MKFLSREYFWFGIIAVLLILFFIEKCKHMPPSCPVVKEVVIDTQYLSVHDTIPDYHPVPGAIVKVPVPVYIKPADEFSIVPEFDTARVLADYYSKVFYSDTQRISYGSIIIEDTISRNRIATRRLFTDFKIPEITKTVTMVEAQRNKIFFGIDGLIEKRSAFAAGGVDLMLLTKKERAYSIGAMYSTKNDLIFTAGYKAKISLRRK